MKHLKRFQIFENDIEDELLDLKNDVSEIFREYADQYNLSKIDDSWFSTTDDGNRNVYSVTESDYGNQFSIEICIYFDDFFGSAGDGEGYLSEKFEYSIEEFIKRVENMSIYNCKAEIDWEYVKEGGSIYQIIIKTESIIVSDN